MTLGAGGKLDMPLEEAMRTQRAVRRFLPQEVPDELLLHLLDLAIRAPSGTNRQGWEFLVVRNREVKRRLGALNRWPARILHFFGRILRRGDPAAQRALEGLRWQAEHFDEIPVVIVACYHGRPAPFPFVATASYFASIFPAVQNLMLAARAAGLGTVLITLPLWRLGAARRILGLPWNVTPCALVPLGWPVSAPGPNRRRPVREVVHLDRYGTPFPPS